MMRCSHALALLLAFSFAFSTEGFRLRHTGGHGAADPHPDTEEPSWAQEESVKHDDQELQGIIYVSGDDTAAETKQEEQDADGSVSSAQKEDEKEEVGPEEADEQNADGSISSVQEGVRMRSKRSTTSRPKNYIHMPGIDCEVWGVLAPAGKACSDSDLCGDYEELSYGAFSGYRIGSNTSDRSNLEKLPPTEFLKSQTDFFAAVTTCDKTRECYRGSDGWNRCEWAPFVYRTKGSKKYTCVTNDENKLATYSVKPMLQSHRRLCGCMECSSGL